MRNEDEGKVLLSSSSTPKMQKSLFLTNCIEINTPCSSGAATLNVARDSTYEVVLSILSELKGLFVDKFLHLGMDEVDYTCWCVVAEHIDSFRDPVRKKDRMWRRDL